MFASSYELRPRRDPQGRIVYTQDHIGLGLAYVLCGLMLGAVFSVLVVDSCVLFERRLLEDSGFLLVAVAAVGLAVACLGFIYRIPPLRRVGLVIIVAGAALLAFLWPQLVRSGDADAVPTHLIPCAFCAAAAVAIVYGTGALFRRQRLVFEPHAKAVTRLDRGVMTRRRSSCGYDEIRAIIHRTKIISKGGAWQGFGLTVRLADDHLTLARSKERERVEAYAKAFEAETGVLTGPSDPSSTVLNGITSQSGERCRFPGVGSAQRAKCSATESARRERECPDMS
jgi:hypothetical protein